MGFTMRPLIGGNSATLALIEQQLDLHNTLYTFIQNSYAVPCKILILSQYQGYFQITAKTCMMVLYPVTGNYTDQTLKMITSRLSQEVAL